MKSTLITVLVIGIGFGGLIGFIAYKELRKEKPIATQSVQGTNTAKKSTQTTSQPSTQTSQLEVSEEPTQQQTNETQEILDPSQFGTYDSLKSSDKLYSIDITKGTGADVVKGKKVAVYYKGWLSNGTVFDQSRPDEKGQLQPFVFTPGAGQVIQGWEQGIIGMKVGGTRRLIIPPVGGYGEAGTQGIPGNSVLIFDIQLLEVEK